MPAHGDEAASTGAGVRKPSMKETRDWRGFAVGLALWGFECRGCCAWRTAERCRALADEDAAHE